MKAAVSPLAAVALLVLAACGARVSVGFVDLPEDGGLTSEGGVPTPPFADDASRPETSPPSPGCEDKSCGAFCTPCEGDAASCPPVSVFHVCSSLGECQPMQPGCIVIHDVDANAPGSYVPCAGRACGAACTSCDPSKCPAPVSGVCHADGACGALPADCR